MAWDYTDDAYKKQATADAAWRLERLINHGLKKGEKIDRILLQEHLPHIRIPEDRRTFFELLLWNKPF